VFLPEATQPLLTGVNVIQYVTIASAGNAIDFGDLTQGRSSNPGGCSSATRGVFAGGEKFSPSAKSNVIDYITIASTGNALNFGDLAEATIRLSGTSNSTRGVFGGGVSSVTINVIQFVTIASTGNTTDFGDLLVATERLAACSNAHGGL
jgi:hypothetical protein